jgi:hypothetical protein
MTGVGRAETGMPCPVTCSQAREEVRHGPSLPVAGTKLEPSFPPTAFACVQLQHGHIVRFVSLC